MKYNTALSSRNQNIMNVNKFAHNSAESRQMIRIDNTEKFFLRAYILKRIIY